MPDPAFTRAERAVQKRFPMMSPARRAELVRAVLEAVREPDLAMRKVSTFEAAERDWPAMIDAILIQDPAIPVVGKLVADTDGTSQHQQER
jgi:hypothetical protein